MRRPKRLERAQNTVPPPPQQTPISGSEAAVAKPERASANTEAASAQPKSRADGVRNWTALAVSILALAVSGAGFS